MKLRNKKTGEISDFAFVRANSSIDDYTIADLTEEWEDYEETTGYWYIGFDGVVIGCVAPFDDEIVQKRKAIGNYFETEEEAEKAVEKLKAWKLLKDECNIRFDGIIRDERGFVKGVKIDYDRHQVTFDRMNEILDAVYLLFGGEE